LAEEVSCRYRPRNSIAAVLPPDRCPLILTIHESFLCRQACLSHLAGFLTKSLSAPSPSPGVLPSHAPPLLSAAVFLPNAPHPPLSPLMRPHTCCLLVSLAALPWRLGAPRPVLTTIEGLRCPRPLNLQAKFSTRWSPLSDLPSAIL
jgi:hypothetical protein